MAFAALPITEVDSHRKTVTTNGLKYSYLEYGSPDNPPVILLHGIWSTGAVWHDISVALAETHHVRSVDFRGRSQTEWSPEGDYSTEAYVSDVLGLYKALYLEKASVIGHSMGGGVATALAAEHPGLVESLVVIDSGPVMRAGSAVEFERQLASLSQDFPSMAAARAWQTHALPNISDHAVERRLAARLVERDGRLVWREDPRIRTSRDLIVRPSEDEMWERIDHWLKQIMPVAEEYKIQMACHPSDPGIGYGKTYRGVARVLGMPDGFKKLIDLYDSPYNGMNFCLGCMSEALENPSEEIFDVIRYFGERKKIFNVHFRNIKGKLGNFVEVFPDEGDVDMLKALRTFKEVGYEYMIMPDHVPGISGPEPHQVGFAYTYGYIHALLQAVNE